MELTLTPEVEMLLQQRLQTGRYRDANDVLETALHVLSAPGAEELSNLDTFIQDGIDDVERRDVFTEEESRAYIKAMRARL